MGTFCCLRKSRTKSSAARPTPIAIAATIGHVASKVVITSLKPLPPRSRLTSAAPSIQSVGTRQLSKTIIAVSDARIPSFFSTRATVIPGVLCSTMKGLIPARPAFLSTVAHTTTKPSDFSAAIWPAVQKIFVPLITQWSPSRAAVVVIAAESEPHPGSVIAIAPHLGLPSRKRLRKRSFCSEGPAAITAAPPSPELGVDRNRPASPQQSSSVLSTVYRLRSRGLAFASESDFLPTDLLSPTCTSAIADADHIDS